MNKLYNFIEKLGKPNVMLIVFLIVVLVITGFYQTFSLYTASEGVTILDGLKTFKFILGSNAENSVTIASGVSKKVAITVTNDDKLKLKYGVYYSTSADLSEVELGYKWDTEYLPNGSIGSGKDYIVTIQIDNNSDSDITINFGIKYGLETGGDLQLEEGEHWLEKKWNFSLSEVDAGSYVRYIGNNGCSGMSCSGQNANYVSEDDMGYCYISSHKFNSSGWRIAYAVGDNAYLVSAGSPECMCTNSDGTTSNVSCSSSENVNSDVIYHFNNLNTKVLKYCNLGFASEQTCDINNSWNLNETDFKRITSNTLEMCLNVPESSDCGSDNPLIDIGSHYWFANSIYVNSRYYVYGWFPYASTVGYKFVGGYETVALNGIRPVIKLDDSVVVTGGSGTYADPYIIDNLATVKDLSGNMNNGAVIGGSWDRENGVVTTTADDSSYVDCGLVGYELGNAVSMVLRVKFNEIYANQENALFGNWETAGGGLMLSPLGKLVYGFWTSDNTIYKYYVTDFSPEVDVWYTIVGVYDGANLSLYLNGTLLEWDSDSSEYTDWNASTLTGTVRSSLTFIGLGVNPGTSADDVFDKFSNITYSDALLFTRGLSASEIASDYSEEVEVSNFSDLLLYYDFMR